VRLRSQFVSMGGGGDHLLGQISTRTRTASGLGDIDEILFARLVADGPRSPRCGEWWRCAARMWPHEVEWRAAGVQAQRNMILDAVASMKARFGLETAGPPMPRLKTRKKTRPNVVGRLPANQRADSRPDSMVRSSVREAGHSRVNSKAVLAEPLDIVRG